MSAIRLPGFTADASLYKTRNRYQSAAASTYGSLGQGVVSQMLAVSRTAAGRFSGSCGCGWGYCCCIICYFDNCYFWCWSTVRQVA